LTVPARCLPIAMPPTNCSGQLIAANTESQNKYDTNYAANTGVSAFP